ncbi:methylated-DNA--[protein]-cysteine S-methyltransferase [Variovorax sp. PCZ-1]|uniref:methylated-DNA--[protein]-cysteine S-methyltransferase n=1 Tax=Variovorax sp. PCZ-1 TaxID=2835533 RepID=UPI001BD10B4E|nr:methylated-DNA--[protein]-cysteine S-methyltransferase [Variovorax sp. PCZ-1]MBS7807840.1 methylated-DNA--[protein]-cysteine S-methyltransferase [Variovorax sp. PCZ-1]
MTRPIEFSLFDTSMGFCGIAWGWKGILCVQLPETNGVEKTRARLMRLFPQSNEAPPPVHVHEAIVRITALLSGQHDNLQDIALDMSGVPAFHQKVYRITRAIPPGQTLTYGQIASQLGEPGAARAVGQALGRNPFAPVVPCHRVLAAGKHFGGFSASGGVASKIRLLQIEGAQCVAGAVAQQNLFDTDTVSK